MRPRAAGRGPQPASTTVVLRALGLGDLLTALPALRALRANRPHDRLVLCAPAGLGALVDLFAVVDELVDTDFRRRAPAALTGSLDRDVSLAVNLHGRGPQSHHALAALEPDELVAYAHPGVHEGPAWHPEEHEVVRWCRLLVEHGMAADPTDLHLRPPPPPPWADGATVLHAGASAPARCWPRDRWAELAHRLSQDGHRLVLTGSTAERPLAEAVAAAAGRRARVVAGATTLPELAAIVGGAGLLVAGDTGIAHLATAVRTPSVLLFGPTSPSQWGPPPHLADRHVVLWAGHRGDPHARTPDRGLLALEVDAVATAVERLCTRVTARTGAADQGIDR